ncbi:MAG TPA: hypothetical protein VLQ93_02315 [Myxococcaceae bacterium]|nr:hypothetical protein [Myxococcaceae bacterium]
MTARRRTNPLTPLRRLSLPLALSVISCGGRFSNAYDAFTPYAAPSPTRETHEYGSPREPLHPEGARKVALPSTRPEQQADCVVSLSISGGGSNSAAFAWGALAELNERQVGPGGRSVLEELDYLVSASGGGITALLLMEMLREHRLREGGPLTQEDAKTYLGSARFRGVLDTQMSTVGDVLASGLASWFGNASSKLQRALRVAMVGEGERCQGVEAGPLAAVPRGTDGEFERYVLCRLTPPLRFEDVFVEAGQRASLPAFLPTVTLFETGENLPATRVWLERLGIERLLFALPNSWLGDVARVEELDYVHAVTLSMGFPGIGPVLATAKRGERTYGVTLADGGQSDNLGLWVAYHALRNELLAHPEREAIHVVLDSSIEPETPFVEKKVEDWATVTGERVIGNSLPLLRAARHTSRRNLELRARDELKEQADSYQLFFVTAEDVLDSRELVHRSFRDISDPGACHRAGHATDLETCLANARPCTRGCSPRERLGGLMSTLANERQLAEDLVTLGREAMARAYEGGLKHALERCISRPGPTWGEGEPRTR